ncbi:linoleate 13S-lipoxygenase 3-1, chloroplastic-like [Quercus robur]|uniref:linoleate 13S-lipoxygenase 3-1, chloroplastic-like n=1 Tax=Quercus robur TaxID=38942 RepID=UPI0021610C59|nr:linoleate 13S-lipoxygenase 3-1, chloroplastic-like [Quercus robur]
MASVNHEAMATVNRENQSIGDDNSSEKPVTYKVNALVNVRYDRTEDVKEMMLHLFDAFSNSTQWALILQLLSTEIDPRTMAPKRSKKTILDCSKNLTIGAQSATFKVQFVVDSTFGVPGAITVVNRYEKELFLESVIIEGVVRFSCNSWVQPENTIAHKRIFFSDKPYLPWETPAGLKELREEELRQLSGNGKGLRVFSDRIYDYDMYNDLGNPDKGIEYARPTLGGEKNPHPRRCRTGRPPTNTDILAESPVQEPMQIYVPRDDAMERCKKEDFEVGRQKGMRRNFVPYLASIADRDAFERFSDINGLYKKRSSLEMKSPLAKIVEKVQDYIEPYKFDPPMTISMDASCCLRDDEFGRQALAGINPLSVERLKVFPPTSKLDPSIYGPQDSALKEEHIIGHLNGLSIQQALEENRLYIIDYHDKILPFLNQVNCFDDRKAYATRTIFFLTPIGTLKPIVIELSLPPVDPNSPAKQVLTSPVDATTTWMWQLAKAHVCSNDCGVHQLVHHWLRTHACMEPFIISAHRQLSVMHPIYKLLHPHMRYTLNINALARQYLINAEGIIENDFTTGKHSMLISSAAYKDWWRFDLEGLPEDLIRRGLATRDPTQPHGLRLFIEDYPYANDGLLIWSAIEELVRTYVNYYYKDPSMVCSDSELQAWYYESINLGHEDLKNASWWPRLYSPEDLSSILTTLIWLASAQHAALNYGQYPYGGHIPIRPPLMRKLVPKEDDPDYAKFVADPEKYFLSALPSRFQSTRFMAVIDILSTHSIDEEYLGERKDLSTWSGDGEILEAFYRFSMEMKRIEKEIEKRNVDPNLRNRHGAGTTAYELLIPSSRHGVTCRGVPNSITI